MGQFSFVFKPRYTHTYNADSSQGEISVAEDIYDIQVLSQRARTFLGPI